MPYFLENAGDLLYACPGTGCLGLPRISLTRSLDHRLSIGFRRMVDALKTPFFMPIKFSPERMSHPSHTPSSQTSSNLPGIELVFGILKCTISPNSASLAFDLRPFMVWKDVRPLGRIRHLVMRQAAWRTIHGTAGLSRLTFS